MAFVFHTWSSEPAISFRMSVVLYMAKLWFCVVVLCVYVSVILCCRYRLTVDRQAYSAAVCCCVSDASRDNDEWIQQQRVVGHVASQHRSSCSSSSEQSQSSAVRGGGGRWWWLSAGCRTTSQLSLWHYCQTTSVSLLVAVHRATVSWHVVVQRWEIPTLWVLLCLLVVFAATTSRSVGCT